MGHHAGDLRRVAAMAKMATSLAWAALLRPDKHGATPAHWAVAAARPECLQLLER